MTNRFRTLLIEDNPADALLIREMLQEARGATFEISVAETLAAALTMLTEKSWDVILLDFGLPDSHGIDTLLRIKRKAPQIPIIVFTGYQDEELAVRAVQGGAQDYIVKGEIDSASLSRAIRHAVERKRGEEEIRKAKKLSDALNAINAEIIALTLKEDEVMPHVVEQLARSIEADSAVLYLLVQEEWEARYIYGLPENRKGSRFPRGEIQFSTLHLPENQTILVSERENRALVEEFHINAIISVPLFIGNEIIGALSVHYHRSAVFPEGYYDFVTKVAASVALALQNANLYEERVRAESNYERLSEKYEVILGCAGEGIYGIDPDGNNMFVNRSAASLLGYEPPELEGVHSHYFVHHSRTDGTPYPFEECPVYRTLKEGKSETVSDEIFWKKNGSAVPVEYTTTPILEGDKVVGAVVTFSDITARKQAEEALRKSEEKYRLLFETANDPIFIVDADLNYIDVNKRASEIFGYTREEFLRMSILDLIPPEQVQRSKIEFENLRTYGRYEKFVGKIRRKDGIYLDIEVSSSAFYDKGRFVGSTDIVRDITESKRMEEAITYQATHDILTGLPNRMLFMDYLSHTLSQAHRYRELIAVMFLDLDRFKSINDSLGHAVGDKLLQQLSERLKSCVREMDVVARIGGDEYNILLPQISHMEDAATIARKIIDRLKKPFRIEGHELYVTISIGISLYPLDGKDAETLIKMADIAMYHVKEQGRNNYQFFDPAMNIRTVERMILENQLRQSLERGEMTVFYQPQMKLQNGNVVCAEALVRWQHPERGILSPVEFIPLAEETGFITTLDHWVLSAACAQNKAWQEAGYDTFCVSVNLTARHFQQVDIVEQVRAALSRSGLSPQYLELEITEGTAMRDIETTVSKLQELNEMGVRFAIDDFGTGYSSLSYLKKLPIQKLKIDKSFISGVTNGGEDRAIISAMIAMGHSLRLEVVAEGVETETELRFLKAHSCDDIQGFLFSRPVPADQLPRLLK